MTLMLHTDAFEVYLQTGPDIVDITEAIQTVVRRSGIATGQVSCCMVGSTGSITTIEYEPGVVADLQEAIDRLIPAGITYAHELAWRDGNGHSHVQAALLGPSITVALRKGRLRLGTWQQVVAINHDNRPRHRSVEITVIGTRA